MDISPRKLTTHTNKVHHAYVCLLSCKLTSEIITYSMHQQIHISLLYRMVQNKRYQLSFLLETMNASIKLNHFHTNKAYKLLQLNAATVA